MWSRTVAVLLFCVGVDLSAVSQHETIFLDVDAYQPVPSPDGKLVRLLAVPASKSVRDKRDHAILSLLPRLWASQGRADGPDAWTSPATG